MISASTTTQSPLKSQETTVLRFKQHMYYRKKIKIRNDGMILKYIFDQPSINSMEDIWLESLWPFDFEIKQVKGKDNKVTNVVRGKFNVEIVSVYKSYLSKIIVNFLAKDEYVLQVKEGLQ